MTQRKIELPFTSIGAVTDGQRELYLDFGTGALMISDLSGKEKRVIFRPAMRDQAIAGYLASRDLSMVLLGLVDADRSPAVKYAVIKTDGAGYREIAGYSGSCRPDWSWDNRYVFFCASQPNGTHQILRLSAADGEARKTRASENAVNRPSPDGRFIALAGSPTAYGKVLVAPSEEGEPQVVSDSGRIVDWTRDGRYLVIASARSGTEALYLLPIKDGRLAGDPVRLRSGPCGYGSSNAAGTLVCHSAPGGIYGAWLGTLDSAGRLVDWKPLDVRVSGGSASLALRWSHDSTRIVYGAPAEPGGVNTTVVRLRDMATGEERELYRGASRPTCIWAWQHPSLICSELSTSQTMDLFSIALDSGRIDRLGSISSVTYGKVFFASPDDKVLTMLKGDELFRWDVDTRQTTTVDRITGFGYGGVPVPDERWLARRESGQVEIRPASGGEWRPLMPHRQTESDFMPDGKWLYYHGVDAAGKHSLIRVSTAGGQPERIGDFPGAGSLGGLYISPDGRMVIAEAQVAPEVWMLENFEPKQQTAKK